MNFIDNYVKQVNKTTNFMNIMELDTENKSNIINKGILKSFNTLERFVSSRSNIENQTQTGGVTGPKSLDTRAVASVLLDMTDRIKRINVKLRNLKSIIRRK